MDDLYIQSGFTLKASSVDKRVFSVYMGELLVGQVYWHGRFMSKVSAIGTETGKVGYLFAGHLGHFETQQQALDAIVSFTKNGLLTLPDNYSFVVYQDGSMHLKYTDWKGIIGNKYQTHLVALLVKESDSWQELINKAVKDFETR